MSKSTFGICQIYSLYLKKTIVYRNQVKKPPAFRENANFARLRNAFACYCQIHFWKQTGFLQLTAFYISQSLLAKHINISKQNRSIHPEVFCKKGALKYLTIFVRKHLCQNLLFNKVGGLKPATLSKKRIRYRCFPVNFTKFFWTQISK